MDRLDERSPFACHDHVNGVEVFFTAKTPGQVGCWICGRLKLAAKGTEESELAVTDLGGHVQPILDQDMDGDVIAQLKQLVLGKPFHGPSLPECVVRRMGMGVDCRAETKNLPARGLSMAYPDWKRHSVLFCNHHEKIDNPLK
jgi:hypothetical protein